MDFGNDAIAKYGKVIVQKNCTSKKAISTPEGNFLSYTITVTAGEDGCPDVSVVDSLISNSDCVTYVGITSNATELAATSNEQNHMKRLVLLRILGKFTKEMHRLQKSLFRQKEKQVLQNLEAWSGRLVIWHQMKDGHLHTM